MKNLLPMLLACVLCSLFVSTPNAPAQGTAFIYQGVLSQNGSPINGSNDLTFTLYNAPSAGAAVGTSNVVNDLVMSNGLFSVTLDFGAGGFDGSARWLQIAARPGESTGAYTNLAPRTPITPTPYAIYAGGAALSGTYGSAVTFNNAANQFSGIGSNLTALNASQLTSGTVPAGALSNAWRVGGNAGTTPGTHFLGTSDNQPLELKVNSKRGLRLESQSDFLNESINVIGGYSSNQVSAGVVGATIAGGGALNVFGGNSPNEVTGTFGTVGGGADNVAGSFATVGGGGNNTASGIGATVSGGNANNASGNSATVAGGENSTAAGLYSFAAGRRAKANHEGAFVWADSQNTDFASTADRQFLIRAAGGVGIGTDSPTTRLQVGSFGSTDEFLTIATAGNNLYQAGVKLRHFNPNFGWTLVSRETDNSFRLMSHFNDAAGVERFKVGIDGVIRIGGNVAIGTPNPSGRLSVGTANGTVSIADDSFTPALVMSGGPAPGILRVRNALEIWPNTAGTSPGKIDIRNTSGTANITLDGSNGEVTAVAVNITSDRNAKEQFKPVNTRDVLEKVARLPISEWQYKTQADARHIGPMAQDFREAFSLGRDEKHITSVDADGVALAAIQGLNEKLEEKTQEVDALKKSVAALTEVVNKLAAQQNGGAR